MSGLTAIVYVVSISLVIGLISGWMVQKKGYSFKQYFVSGFIASCGILGIIFKIIMDYIN